MTRVKNTGKLLARYLASGLVTSHLLNILNDDFISEKAGLSFEKVKQLRNKQTW